MKIAVSTESPTPESLVDPRFGRAKCFMIFDDTTNEWEAVDNIQNLNAAQGAGIQAAANVVNAGCSVLLSGHCGPKAFSALAAAGVLVYAAADCSAEVAVEMYRNGTLPQMQNADVEGHW